MIESLRSVPQVMLRLLPPSGLSDQPRYTPRDLANSVPRLPVLDKEEELAYREELSGEKEP